MAQQPPTTDDLARSEEQHRLAFEATGGGFWDWDLVADTWAFSPGLYAMLGYQPDELSPCLNTWTNLMHPDDRDEALSLAQGCAGGECPSFDSEFRLCSKNGEWQWTRCRGRVVGTQASGQPARLIGVHSDIAARRQAEQAHRESEQRYRMLVENQGEGIGIVDVNEVFTYVNPAAEWIFGLEAGTMVGRSLSEFTDAEQLEQVTTQTERRRRGSRDSYELSFRRADGRRRTMLVTAAPQYDEQGDYLGAFGVFRDITDRKHMEDTLRDEEQRYRQLIESLPHGVVLLQRESTVFANQPAVEMLGYERFEDLAAVPPIELLTPTDRERVLGLLTGLRTGELVGPVHYQTVGRHASGRDIPIEAHVTALTYRGELALQLFMMDISERVEAEEQRSRLEKQLRQSQRLESIGRLAGGIAHDFNNLLSPIMLYSDMALQDLRPGEMHYEDFEQIGHAVTQAKNLTQQLLAFGRRQVLQMKVLKINDVVSEAHRLFRRLIREDIEIRLELAPKTGNLKADPSQLQQVLMNLAINARDSMDQGGVMTIRTADAELDEAHCSRHTNLTPGPYVTLEVADTGRGMAPETLAQIYEPFFTTKETGKGTGLGLATVHGIVMQHGGHIDVVSEPGAGTTFTVLLPQVEETKPLSRRPSPMAFPELSKATVLVAEDDDQLRAQVQRILEKLGLEVITATDGADAIGQAADYPGPIDLLLTDVIMPRMNGRELYQELRKTRPAVQVIFMSGYTDDVIADQQVMDEETLFLQKPFSMAALSQALRAALVKDGRP